MTREGIAKILEVHGSKALPCSYCRSRGFVSVHELWEALRNKRRWYVMREQLPWWLIEALCWNAFIGGGVYLFTLVYPALRAAITTGIR